MAESDSRKRAMPLNGGGQNGSSPDLRRTKSIRLLQNYPLNYLNYTYGNQKDCTIMTIIEKQTKYPTYTEQYGDAIYSIIKWMATLGGVTHTILGNTGENIAENTMQLAGKSVINARVSNISKNSVSYWNPQGNYVDRFKNLFVTEIEKGVITYEIPFFSDYWLETDGEAGWKRPGAEMMLGKQMGQVLSNIANIGYPSTPDWEFTPHYPELKFKFHLINDTIDHLKNHLIWLSSFATGQMYAQLDISDKKAGIDDAMNAISGEIKDKNGAIVNTEGTEVNVNELAGILNEALGNYTSLYKSPNVYEIIVPGRLRWMWATIATEITCKGKFYKSKINTGITTFDYASSVFPEVFEISISVKSLVPQAFNTYLYFLNTNPTEITASKTQTAAQEMLEVLKKLPKEVLKKLSEKIPTLGKFFSDALK